VLLWLMIGLRVVANPGSNALQKLLAGRGLSPLLIIVATHLGLTLLIIPWLMLRAAPTAPEFWNNLLASAALATLSNTLIVYPVHGADLSLVGPINSFKPAVSIVPGPVLLRECPTAGGIVGIALVIAGSWLLTGRISDGARPPFWRLFLDRGVQLPVAALIPSAIEAVFLKRALQAVPAADVFAWWSVLCLVAVALALTASRGWREAAGSAGTLRATWGTALALVVTTGAMQLCTLLTLERMQVGYSLALFQTSTILTVRLGRALFHEPHFGRRLAGLAVMAAGAAVIVVAS
jgi:drug/metabolite transporter (DMT)-like permease